MLVEEKDVQIETSTTAPLQGDISLPTVPVRTTSKRRRTASVRWTSLLSWSCKYYAQSSLLLPNWRSCLSNSGIALYRLATMGELDSLIELNVSSTNSNNSSTTNNTGGTIHNDANITALSTTSSTNTIISPLVAPTPRPRVSFVFFFV